MAETMIRMRGVRKAFGREPVLRGVDMTLEQGRFVGLAGVNGAGKTTLLKCLLDFTAVDDGTIEIFGVQHSQPHARARLAFLPERFSPPHYLTGRDFLRFMAALHGERYREERARQVMTALDLDADALGRSARSYSKGMTQKLGLAAAFLAERDLLVLDEPMSGLDPKARACVKALLRDVRSAGRSVFFTSHSLPDIEECCDEVVVLHRGVPYFAGTPRQLCQDFGGCSIEQAFLRCIEADKP